MSAQYIERCTLRVLGVDLDDVINSIEESSDRPTKVVNTMNKGRVGRGFKQGNNGYVLSLNAEQIFDPIVPDWHDMKDTGKVFSLVKVPSVGPSITYSGCKITSVKDSTSDGDSTRSISVTALRRRSS